MSLESLYKAIILFIPVPVLASKLPFIGVAYIYVAPILMIDNKEYREYGISIAIWNKETVLLLLLSIALLLPVYPVLKMIPAEKHRLTTKFVAEQLILVSIPEELFFRGLIQTLIKKSLKKPNYTICLTSLIFASAHIATQSPIYALMIFFPGLVLSMLRNKSKSIIPGIIVHLIYNLSFLST